MKVVTQTTMLDTKEFVDYQLFFYCFVNKKRLTNAQSDILSWLLLHDNYTKFPYKEMQKDGFENVQSLRSNICVLKKMGFIDKYGKVSSLKDQIFIEDAVIKNIIYVQ